jgi:hypothetical protein
VIEEFADDPDLHRAIIEREEAKTREINDLVRTGLKNLTRQLGGLQLVHGDAMGLVERLQKNMGS